MTSDDHYLVVPIRLRPQAVERVDALLAQGPATLSRSQLIRMLVAHALDGFPVANLRPPEPTPDERQAKRDARIKEPAWAPEMRALHAPPPHGEGLTNAELAERLRLTEVNVRARLKRLGLPANRSRR